MTQPTPGAAGPSIDVQNLSYKFQDGSAGLEDVLLSLPPGSRTLLIGGRTTIKNQESFLRVEHMANA